MMPLAVLRHKPLDRAVQFWALTISCGGATTSTSTVAAPSVNKEKQESHVLLGKSELDPRQMALDFGQEKYRRKQLYHLLYKRKVKEIPVFSHVPLAFRNELHEAGRNVCRSSIYKSVTASNGTVKYHFSSLVAQACREHPMSKESLKSSTLEFDSHVYGGMLQHCIKNNDPTGGQILHCQILKKGNCLDLFARNILLNLYVKTEFFLYGLNLFDEMPDRNVVSFVTVIQGYAQLEEYGKALDLFFRLHKEGHELNPFVFTTIIKLLVSMDWVELAWQIHACIHKVGHDSDAFVGTALIDAYSVYGFVNVAKEVFKGIIRKDMVCWTGMVSCYAENDCFEDALDLFNHMRMEGLLPNNFTFASVIKAWLGLEAIGVGKSVHGCILKTCYDMDQYVGVSLLDLYTRSGDIKDARQVFDEIPKDHVVPWSFMIARYSQSDHCEEALDLFLQMRKAFVSPNQFTLASVLQACATAGDLKLGTQIHGHMLKVGLDLNVFALNALMDVYAKCGKMENSMSLFVGSGNTNEVSWNTLIVGYVQLGDAENAFQLVVPQI